MFGPWGKLRSLARPGPLLIRLRSSAARVFVIEFTNSITWRFKPRCLRICLSSNALQLFSTIMCRMTSPLELAIRPIAHKASRSSSATHLLKELSQLLRESSRTSWLSEARAKLEGNRSGEYMWRKVAPNVLRCLDLDWLREFRSQFWLPNIRLIICKGPLTLEN